MKIDLRPRDRRALLLLGAALAGYLFLDYALLPGWDRLGEGSAIAAHKEAELLVQRRALRREEGYADLEEALQARLREAEPLLIEADNQSLASVQLQAAVDQAAREAGIGVAQRTIAGSRDLDDYFSETAMTIAFTSSPGQLITLLSQFRAGEKFLTVRSLEVAPTELVQGLIAGQGLAKTLRVNLTVAALAPKL